MTKELTKKEIKRQMKSLEILEVEATLYPCGGKEIGNILELDDSILDNIKINIDRIYKIIRH